MDININNVILYIDDAVRYDYAEKRLANIGKTYQSVASSLTTPASFSSIYTGRHPQNHGVTDISGFNSNIDLHKFTIFDIPEHDVYISDRGGMNESVQSLFKICNTSGLSELSSDFVWTIRGPGGHAPYGGYDPKRCDVTDIHVPEYFMRHAGNTAKLVQDYKKGVEKGIDEFEEVVEEIRDRGLEEETLLVYTSDHGELLGEYGMVGHSYPACPELVYVPTTLVHPDIESGQGGKLVSNVDIFPTILDTLGFNAEEYPFDGDPIWSLSSNQLCYNQYGNKGDYLVQSVWNKNGGHAFVQSSYWRAMKEYVHCVKNLPRGRHTRRTREFIKSLNKILPGHIKYGSPTVSKRNAKKHIEKISQKNTNPNSQQFNEDLREHLENMGYLK